MVMFVSGITLAQAPQRFNYQAVVRDNGGASVTNMPVGVRVSILEGSTLGPTVFSETHGPTTNGYGLINIQIGAGTNTGPALSTIDWGANIYFVKIEIDPTGGTNYSISSTTQLLSVPYALHAKTVENAADADADPTNEYNTGAILNADTLEITDGGGTINVDMSALKNDPDMDPNNEIQTLSKVGQIVSLSGGGGAFTDDVDDADNNPSNELNTTFTLVGTTLQITDAGGTLNANLSSLGNDADADPSNELQTISKTGSTVTLSDGGGSFTDEVNDADADPSNELQTISKSGSTVTLSNGGGSFTDAVNDADADPTNELQTVNKVGNTVTLSNSGGSFTVDDSDASATNEFNTGASLVGTDLNITDGGGTLVVDLSSLVGGGDPSSTNELNTGAVLNGTDLEITDAGGTLIVDLSSLGGGGDPSSTNELNTGAVLNGTDLEITDAGGTLTVDLSSLSGGSDIKVGQIYQGGVVVYVDSTGIHGLICALTDAATGVEFEASPNQLTVFASSFTDGAANTNTLVNGAGASHGFTAASAADSYSAGGYTDWYLPAAYELEMILRLNYVLGANALSLGVQYWSSTEDPAAAGFNAYRIQNNTTYIETTSEANTANVRAVRAF